MGYPLEGRASVKWVAPDGTELVFHHRMLDMIEQLRLENERPLETDSAAFVARLIDVATDLVQAWDGIEATCDEGNRRAFFRRHPIVARLIWSSTMTKGYLLPPGEVKGSGVSSASSSSTPEPQAAVPVRGNTAA